MSAIVEQHLECTVNGGCGSSDAMQINSDGWRHCHSCSKREGPIKSGRISDRDAQPARAAPAEGFDPLPVRYFENKDRCIALATCRKYDYGEGEDRRGQWTHITGILEEDGTVVGQKMRYKDKRFVQIGNQPRTTRFWGQHLFSGGKRLIITEGEFDAMSAFEAMGSSWPVVSLPNGTGSVERVFKGQLKWLDSFDEVVLMFDQDKAGVDAKEKAVKILPPGKAKVATLDLKDANEMWRAGRGEEIKHAVWNAQSARPDEILGTTELWDRFTATIPNASINWPWPTLQTMWNGWRTGEITLIGAGSGVGKSTLLKHLMCHAIEQGDKAGGIFLEENVRRSAQGFLTYFTRKPVHLLMTGNYQDMDAPTRGVLRSAWDEQIKDNLELYDHFGSMDPEDLVGHLRFMAVGLGCKTLVLDHITMLANAAGEGMERLVLDATMADLRSMVEQTGVRLIIVSHLNRPTGRPYEEGAQIHLGSFRGSTQLVCLSDNVLGAERNQQHPTNKNFTRLRSLKCRITGNTGVADWLKYEQATGYMGPSEAPAGGLEVAAGQETFDSQEGY